MFEGGTAFTEMFNNVLDHSSAAEATVEIRKTAIDTQMVIYDNGVGIFKKIQQALSLPDERYAIIELSRGNLRLIRRNTAAKASSSRRECATSSTFYPADCLLCANQTASSIGYQRNSKTALRSG